MRSLVLALTLLIGCDTSTPSLDAVVRISGVEVAAVRPVDDGGPVRYVATSNLTGTFRFAVGAVLTTVSQGDCNPTSSGECLPNLLRPR